MSKSRLTQEEYRQAFQLLVKEGGDQELSREEMEKLAEQTGNYITRSDIKNMFYEENKESKENEDSDDSQQREDNEKSEKSKIKLDDFLFWYEHVKVKGFQKLYEIKKKIDQKLNKIRDQIKNNTYQKIDTKATMSNFGVSITNGSNNKEFQVGIKLFTQNQANTQSTNLKSKLEIGNEPAIILKIKVSKNIIEAKRQLEALVDQTLQVIECLIPEKLATYNLLSLVDIKIDTDGNYLLLQIKSNNEIINKIYQSYIDLVQDLNMNEYDQSTSIEISYSSQINIGKLMANQNTSVFEQLIKGLNIDANVNISSLTLDNYRATTYKKIEAELNKNNNQLAPRKVGEFGLLVISQLLNGVSLQFNVEDFQEMMPPKVQSFQFSDVIPQLKVSKAEQFLTLPIFEDFLKFFNDFTKSEFNVNIIGPGIFIEFYLKTENLSSFLNKVLSVTKTQTNH